MREADGFSRKRALADLKVDRLKDGLSKDLEHVSRAAGSHLAPSEVNEFRAAEHVVHDRDRKEESDEFDEKRWRAFEARLAKEKEHAKLVLSDELTPKAAARVLKALLVEFGELGESLRAA